MRFSKKATTEQLIELYDLYDKSETLYNKEQLKDISSEQADFLINEEKSEQSKRQAEYGNDIKDDKIREAQDILSETKFNNNIFPDSTFEPYDIWRESREQKSHNNIDPDATLEPYDIWRESRLR